MLLLAAFAFACIVFYCRQLFLLSNVTLETTREQAICFCVAREIGSISFGDNLNKWFVFAVSIFCCSSVRRSIWVGNGRSSVVCEWVLMVEPGIAKAASHDYAFDAVDVGPSWTGSKFLWDSALWLIRHFVLYSTGSVNKILKQQNQWPGKCYRAMKKLRINKNREEIWNKSNSTVPDSWIGYFKRIKRIDYCCLRTSIKNISVFRMKIAPRTNSKNRNGFHTSHTTP